MKEYKLTDQEVRWVAVCLSDLRRHAFDEIVEEYNQQHPTVLPPIVRKSGRMLETALDFLMQKKGADSSMKEPKSIRQILTFLEKQRPPLVASEVFTFDEEPIPPTKKYVLTAAGIQYVHGKRR